MRCFCYILRCRGVDHYEYVFQKSDMGYFAVTPADRLRKADPVHLSTTEPDPPISQTETVAQAETPTYILNTASKKIHLPGCGSVAKIKNTNKEDYSGSLSDLEDQGYTRCGSCKPE